MKSINIRVFANDENEPCFTAQTSDYASARIIAEALANKCSDEGYTLVDSDYYIEVYDLDSNEYRVIIDKEA